MKRVQSFKTIELQGTAKYEKTEDQAFLINKNWVRDLREEGDGVNL
jgi:hypothetical protein